jgi:gamma-glutamyltranspeptidase
LPDRARFETKRPLDPTLVAALKARGHRVIGSHLAMGDSNDLLIEGDLAYGVADPRGGGLAQAAMPPVAQANEERDRGPGPTNSD